MNSDIVLCFPLFHNSQNCTYYFIYILIALLISAHCAVVDHTLPASTQSQVSGQSPPPGHRSAASAPSQVRNQCPNTGQQAVPGHRSAANDKKLLDCPMPGQMSLAGLRQPVSASHWPRRGIGLRSQGEQTYKPKAPKTKLPRAQIPQ